MQRGEQLVPFKTTSGDTLEILYLGELTAEVWELIMIGWLQMFAVVLDVLFYPTGVCVVSRRTCLPKNISITVWRPGDWGPQAGPLCSWAFSSPCASSTHWVNIDPPRPRREVLLVLTFSAPCLQWTGFPFWESWCLWGWSSSPCACLAPCLCSPSQQAGFFTARWWLRLWRRSLWSRCSWPAQDFRPKRTSDCLRGNKGSGTCEQRCWPGCPALHKTRFTVLLSEVREERQSDVLVFHQSSLIWTS